jgi:hypothetical protein
LLVEKIDGNILMGRFEVLTAASMKMAVFWVVAPIDLPNRNNF